MADFGALCLFVALATSAWAALASYNGWRARLGELVLSAERAIYVTWALVFLAVLSLQYCIFTDQFDLEYVASYSNRALPGIYKFTALWGGQAGSLLFWQLILISYASLIVFTNRRRNRSLMPLVVTTLAVVSTFFLGLVCFMARPFVRLAFIPEDGNGLNPQLQNPFMAIHPPCLYLGYVGLTLPFAFAIAALVTGRLDDTWFRTTRRWTILSWFFLGTGVLLGGWWAYVELGWGGYWAWDPVENASLIPWLTCTAFLHSVMIEERKKMLRVWNLSLVIMSFLLSILGTFITRSGVISSVHSFTKSEIGPVFAAFLGLCTLVSVGLLLYRLPLLQSEHRLDSFVSRESTFLFNNLLLVGAAFAVLWGTLFPILSEAVRGVKITVGPPFFNEIMVPIAFALVTLAGICPVIAWRRASARKLMEKIQVPFWALIGGAAALLLSGVHDVYAIVSFSLATFVITTTVMEFWWGTRSRLKVTGQNAASAFLSLVDRNKRRYGGFVVHLGFILIVIGVTGSTVFKQEATASLRRGESFSVGRYRMVFEDMVSHDDANREFMGARLAVFDGARRSGTLVPGQNFYKAGQNPSTEVDIRYTLRDDLYLILTGFDPQEGRATLKAYLNPLVNWIWIGGGVLILGAWFAMLPDIRDRRRDAEAKLREVESRAA
ncbi:MAG TPA: heme lyase CcmF/NrfE family subunit [Candidatus Polarisedimenticolia bacterium]|jgi:cytochrome c-type biogenesis protein CcmF|nr:heme lyase CcmF/NrfE family subunit [Candidatus Polarisedimenticolia bacterium]